MLIGGEFGRTPAVEVGGLVKVQNGRDHNNHGFTYLVAGGGFKRGYVHGATDDFGFKSVDKPVHIHDLHATVLQSDGAGSQAADVSLQRPRLPADRRSRRTR